MFIRIFLYIITIPALSWSGHLIKTKTSLETAKAFSVFSALAILSVLWFVIMEFIFWLRSPKSLEEHTYFTPERKEKFLKKRRVRFWVIFGLLIAVSALIVVGFIILSFAFMGTAFNIFS